MGSKIGSPWGAEDIIRLGLAGRVSLRSATDHNILQDSSPSVNRTALHAMQKGIDYCFPMVASCPFACHKS
eukprot:5054906-Amphidinium_carterae.1